MSLDGIWALRWSDGQRGRLEYGRREPVDSDRMIAAQVPGEVHWDLWRAGVIADPYVGINCLSARWVEEFLWTYRREFEAPAEAVNGDQTARGAAAAPAWLVFEGLDLNAVIVLNGKEVGRHANAFYPCRIEVTGKLRSGMNTLLVELDSGVWSAADKPARGWEHWPDQALNKRHWLRKPQFQFGWDWSQRLINVGIFKSVRLEWSDAPARVDQVTALAEVSQDWRRGWVRVRMFVEGLGPAPAPAPEAGATRGSMEGRLKIELNGAGAGREFTVAVRPGANVLEGTIEVENPQLWWPIGHGPQTRYTLRVGLEIDGRTIGGREIRVGFRHVRVDQSPHPGGGRFFTLVINGRRIFARGGNFVPADMILARIDRARYERLIDLAVEQNFNFLRVWGGGLYESDDFYELCDQRGILVWQEFIFACSRYPMTDEVFFNDVKAEARYNIRRLASHPSLIAWCGNNEIEWGDWDWDYGRSGVILPDLGFFHLALPRLLSEEDPGRYYQPSSPHSPDGLHPNSDQAGDQHPWSVGFFNQDFREYRKMICRFADEGGMLGPTSLPTMLACLPPDHRRVLSLAWQIHDNAVATWTYPSAPNEFIRQWLGKEPREMSIEQFTYWAGLLQGEGLREYCENFRRRMFDSSAAVFWMFNDCWPATRSWTTVDYFLRRTPAFHAVRRALAPVHVALAQEGDEVVVFGLNDTAEEVRGTLISGVVKLDGGKIFERESAVALAPAASTRLGSFAGREWTQPEESVAFARLEREGELLARNRLMGPMFSQMCWAKPAVEVSVRGGKAIFRSAAFAWGVCIDLEGERALSDNFFDVYPDEPYAIAWSEADPPRVRFVGNLVDGAGG
jgi:beta-mannosidase